VIRGLKLNLYQQQGKVACLGCMIVSCSPFGQAFVLFAQKQFRADCSTIVARISSPTLTYACLTVHGFHQSKICRHRSKLIRTKLDRVTRRSVGAAPSEQSAAHTSENSRSARWFLGRCSVVRGTHTQCRRNFWITIRQALRNSFKIYKITYYLARGFGVLGF